MSEKTF